MLLWVVGLGKSILVFNMCGSGNWLVCSIRLRRLIMILVFDIWLFGFIW